MKQIIPFFLGRWESDFNAKMLKKIYLALLTKKEHNFKNVEALLSLLGPCSKI